MKTFEILSIIKPVIDDIINKGINPYDAKYIDLYNDYKRLEREGHKIRWIAVYLSDEYGISERSVFNIINRLNKEI